MKSISALLGLLCSFLYGFGQSDTTLSGLPDSLTRKLKSINDYVAKVDALTNLKTVTRRDILLDNTETTAGTEYVDSVSDDVVKRVSAGERPTESYYLDNSLVYTKALYTQPVREIYYEDGSVIYANFDLDKEQILAVSYFRCRIQGDMVSLRISEKSINMARRKSISAKQEGKNKTNDAKSWNTLLSTIKLSDFVKIKSDKLMPQEFADYFQIEISTPNQTYFILDGGKDRNPERYKSVSAFVKALQAQVSKYAGYY